MNSVKQLLQAEIQIKQNTVSSQQIGDETLWLVSNCKVTDLVKFFQDPVKWVAAIPTMALEPVPALKQFSLASHYVVHFKILDQPSDNLRYLISGIDGTGVITVRVQGHAVELFTEQINQAIFRRLGATEDNQDLFADIHSIWSKQVAAMKAAKRPINIEVSPDGKTGFGHTQFILAGDSERAVKVAGYLSNCSTNVDYLNSTLCNNLSETFILPPGSKTPVPTPFHFAPATPDVLKTTTFLYQGTEGATSDVCEYGVGAVNPDNSITLDTSIVKDY